MSRNRNQRRNANAANNRSAPGVSANARSIGFDKNIAVNFARELENLIAIGKQYPIQAVGTVASFVTTIAGAIELFTGGSDTSSGYNSSPGLLDGMLSFLPGRIMAFFILTISLGWFVSLINIWLTSRLTEVRTILAHVVTACGAMLLALSVESIFSGDIQQNPLFFLLLGIIGATGAIFIVKTNFKLKTESNMHVIALRASLLVNFACITAGLIVFSQFWGF